MPGRNPVAVGPVLVGLGQPLVLIVGPCVMEPNDLTLVIARRLRAIADELQVPMIFKASFDKANRTSKSSYRGPGLREGLKVFERVKAETGFPGRPMNAAPALSFRTCPYANGLPGFSAIFHILSSPTACTAGLTWSSSPADTPPLVMIRSLSTAASRRTSCVARRSSRTMPKSRTSHPSDASKPRSRNRFEL